MLERNRPARHVRLGRRLLRRDARQSARAPTSRRIARSPAAFAHWDDIDIHFKGHDDRLERPRLLRHRAQAAARRSCKHRAAELGVELRLRDATSTTSQPCAPTATCSSARDGVNSRVARDLRRGVRAEHRPPPVPLRVARHDVAARRVHVHLRARPSTAGSPSTPTGSMRRRARSSSSAARRRGCAHGLDAADTAQTIAFCERLFAPYLHGHRADGQQRRTCADAIG